MQNIQDITRSEKSSVTAAFKTIFSIWYKRLPALLFGIFISLIAVLLGLALMSFAGGKVALTAMGAIITSSLFLKMVGVSRMIMRYVERLFTHNAMFHALADLRIWFFRTLAMGSAAGLGFRHSGDILSRLVSDIETLDGLYLRLILPFFGSILTSFVLFTVIAHYNLALAVSIVICYGISAFLCPFGAGFITRKRGKKLVQGTAQLRITVLDFIHGLREIRAFGAEHRVSILMKKNENELFDQQYIQAREVALIGVIAYFFGQVAVLFVLMSGLNIGFHGLNAFHTVFCLFLTITAFELVVPLSKAGGLAGQIVNAAIRVVNINDNKKVEDNSKSSKVAPESGDIKFRDVSFRWGESQPWLYRNLNLTIEQGKKIAIIGSSGVGKSTLAALLLKVIQPIKGSITLADQNLDWFDNESVRKRIAWLSQNTHLFDDTIRQNLLLGNPDATEEDLWQALSDAAVANVVREMPDGLDTWLGEGGVKVSGGQGRRIALARTMLLKAPILLLDEPTSGLDGDTEKAFFQTLNQITGNRTVILIMHRLTGVENIDEVWRLSNGQLVAE